MRIIGGAIPSIVYASTAVQRANAQTFTFNGQAAGPAKSSRYLVVGLTATVATNSVRINGVTMTPLYVAGPLVYILAVPDGDTVQVSVTQALSTTQTVAITITALYDISSATPTDSTASGASPAVLDLDVAGRGIIWAMSTSNADGGASTWTGLTENLDQTSAINNLPRSIATVAATGSEAPRVVRCAYSASSFPLAISFSWR